MKKLLFIILSILAIQQVEAQNTKKQSKKELRRQRINAIIRQEEDGLIAYRKHTVVGFKLTNDGYGGFFEIGRAQTINKGLLYQLEISERKHAKEDKQQVYTNTAPEIFGKINFFYPVKLGVQKQFLFGNKGNKNGVTITGNVGGGFVAGLLRPYMIEVEKNGERVFVEYNSSDSTAYFLDPNTHIGGPNFSTGWNKLKFTPGLYLKPALRFDYAKYNELVSAIEVGVSGEFYSKKIPQVVYTKERQFFFSAFVSIMFGRRK